MEKHGLESENVQGRTSKDADRLVDDILRAPVRTNTILETCLEGKISNPYQGSTAEKPKGESMSLTPTVYLPWKFVQADTVLK